MVVSESLVSSTRSILVGSGVLVDLIAALLPVYLSSPFGIGSEFLVGHLGGHWGLGRIDVCPFGGVGRAAAPAPAMVSMTSAGGRLDMTLAIVLGFRISSLLIDILVQRSPPRPLRGLVTFGADQVAGGHRARVIWWQGLGCFAGVGRS